MASVAAENLLERDAELARLRETYDRIIESGSGRVVFLRGEAGVGKTALLRRFAVEQTVVVGACEPLFTPRPLGPLLEIAPAADTPYEVVTALTQETAPQILALEDVHWADEATLDVLRLLARRIETVPMLLIATYRDDELDNAHPLRIVLGELGASPYVQRLTLTRLSAAAIAQLAAVHAVDPDELYRKTSGNPFFAMEVLDAGIDGIPDTVRDAVLARGARLGPEARALLEAVAIVPARAELDLLEALVDSTAPLEECIASGMLVAAGAGVAFRHELARLAIEESIAPDRRLALHRRALAKLDDPARLAHHAEAAGDEDAVLLHAPEAALRASRVGAHREAAAQYARALRFDHHLSRDERADLLERRSRECYLTDHYDEAIDAIQEALGLRRELGQTLRVGDDLRWLSELLWCPGRVAECEWTGREAVTLLETLPPGRELARAYVALADRYARAAHDEEAIAWGERAVALAEQLGDEESVIHARTTIAACRVGTDGSGPLEDNLERARRAGLVEEVSRAYTCIASTGAALGRFDVLPLVLAGITYTSERGAELYRHYLLAYYARLQLDRGRWDQAAVAATQVVRVARTSTTPRITALVVLALIRARRGDPGVRDTLDEAWRLAEPTRELPRVGPVAAAKAEIAWLEGDGTYFATIEAQNTAHFAEELNATGLAATLAEWRRRSNGEQVDALAAAERWRAAGCPYEAALARADAGDEASLRTAFHELQELGAHAAAAVVARRLREIGARSVPRGPRPATRENAAGLTARELEVLGLLVEGLGNADVASRLVLSRRTVEHHVAAILRKLGVATRTAAAEEAVRLGLTS